MNGIARNVHRKGIYYNQTHTFNISYVSLSRGNKQENPPPNFLCDIYYRCLAA